MGEETVVLIAFLVFGGFVTWIVQRRAALKVNVAAQRQHLLRAVVDKFVSAEEMVTFIRSPEGQKLLGSPAEPFQPRLSVLRFVQCGIVLLFTGASLYLNAWLLRFATDINEIRKALDLKYWGTLSVSAGLALLVVAGVSHWLLRRWGLWQSKVRAE